MFKLFTLTLLGVAISVLATACIGAGEHDSPPPPKPGRESELITVPGAHYALDRSCVKQYKKEILPAGRKLVEPQPNKVTTVDGICPFEGCMYDDQWIAMRDVDLVKEIGSKEVVGKVKKNQRVTAVTGSVLAYPLRVKITEPTEDYEKKSISKDEEIDYLSYLGEFTWLLRHKDGRQDKIESDLGCIVPENHWWVKIKISKNEFGWARVENNFGNNDELGWRVYNKTCNPEGETRVNKVRTELAKAEKDKSPAVTDLRVRLTEIIEETGCVF